jgi:hypothetical protein
MNDDPRNDEHLTEDGLIELVMGEAPTTRQAHHLAHCGACSAQRDSLREVAAAGQAALELLERVAPLDGDARARVLTRLERRLRPKPRWTTALVGAGLLVAATSLAARHVPSSHTAELAIASLTLAAAMIASLASRTRFAREVALGTIAASLGLGILDSHQAGGLEVGTGLQCSMAQLGLAAAAAAAMHWSGAAAGRADILAASAGAGALAGQAALMIVCHAPGSLLHGLAFHTLGVLLAVGLARAAGTTLYGRVVL